MSTASRDWILAIDAGTTGVTCLIRDRSLQRVSEASVDFAQHFPKPGWVEHDLEEIWAALGVALTQALADIDTSRIVAIGITNQRETICFWDRKTRAPLARAIVWQDRRTAERCAELRAQGAEALFRASTGLVLDPYFSGTKVAWALENWPEVSRAHAQGRLAVGTIDSYLIARLTGSEQALTEPSNASRTLAFGLKSLRFEAELSERLGVPLTLWPEVRPSIGSFGKTRNSAPLPDAIPITGVVGDQQSALLGQACIEIGMAKCTYGTGAFLLANTGDSPILSEHRLLTTVAWQLASGKTTYALEGSAFVAGSAVQWVRDGLGLIQHSQDIEPLATSVASTEGVTFVPALAGLGAPHWDPHARGLFCGLTRGTTRAHIARAVLEGIAFQNVDLLQAMDQDLLRATGARLRSLKVDGGAAANNFLMQFQADMLGVRLSRPASLESTSLGAVFAAGLGVGLWSELGEIERAWLRDREFAPSLSASDRERALAGWRRAVDRARGA